MVEIKGADDTVSIGAIDRSMLDTVVELYNSSEGCRYATGIAYPVTKDDIIQKLDKLDASNNEFFSGIYLNNRPAGSKLLAGVISGILDKNIMWIKLIAILPEFRRNGIGSRAAGLVINCGRMFYGISEVLLSVIERNEDGMRFWMKHGFTVASRFTKKLFEDKSPYGVVIMRKKLQ